MDSWEAGVRHTIGATLPESRGGLPLVQLRFQIIQLYTPRWTDPWRCAGLPCNFPRLQAVPALSTHRCSLSLRFFSDLVARDIVLACRSFPRRLQHTFMNFQENGFEFAVLECFGPVPDWADRRGRWKTSCRSSRASPRGRLLWPSEQLSHGSGCLQGNSLVFIFDPFRPMFGCLFLPRHLLACKTGNPCTWPSLRQLCFLFSNFRFVLLFVCVRSSYTGHGKLNPQTKLI